MGSRFSQYLIADGRDLIRSDHQRIAGGCTGARLGLGQAVHHIKRWFMGMTAFIDVGRVGFEGQSYNFV